MNLCLNFILEQPWEWLVSHLPWSVFSINFAELSVCKGSQTFLLSLSISSSSFLWDINGSRSFTKHPLQCASIWYLYISALKSAEMVTKFCEHHWIKIINILVNGDNLVKLQICHSVMITRACKENIRTCATRKNSNQSAHLHILFRVFTVCYKYSQRSKVCTLYTFLVSNDI